ncbi:hypothetical protein P7K49_005873 [Saguinus oedipus]|uniref:Uncharacterized protein n=1 Tax=Saguinus oedipus TaxID=9490 RepID=A0ABQ9W0S8_SAGOE|nr:hypothetical protein P7K49_005873 [Saguinus oedipus]
MWDPLPPALRGAGICPSWLHQGRVGRAPSGTPRVEGARTGSGAWGRFPAAPGRLPEAGSSETRRGCFQAVGTGTESVAGRGIPSGLSGQRLPGLGDPRRAADPRPLPAALCFALSRSLLLTCLVPAALLGLRYYYSRKVIRAYLECALHTDMADIEQYYMKPPGESRPPPQTALGGTHSSNLRAGQGQRQRGWAWAGAPVA